MENPYAKYAQPQAGPISSGVKPVDPYKDDAEQRARDRELRDARKDALSNQKDLLDLKEKTKKLEDGDIATAVGEERKAAAFLIRALGANDSYEKLKIGPRSLVGQGVADIAPGVLNSLPSWMGNSDSRQVADTNQDEFIAASLRQDSGASIPEEEMERQRRIYFPMPGDSDAVIEAKRQARIRAIEGLKQSSGKLLDETLQRYETLGTKALDEQKDDSLPAGTVRGGTTDGLPDGVDPNDVEYYARDEAGNLVGYQPKDGSPFVTLFDSGNIRERDARIQAAADAQDRREGSAGFIAKADSGLLYGLQDEIQGVGGAIGSALRLDNPIEGYQFARDVARERYNRADQATGLAGDAVEVGAGLLLPAGNISTVQQGIRTGAKLGGLGGFGYGEGLQGSTTNALIGTGLGATVGGLAAKGSNALANRAAARAEAAPARNALLQAGADEGVTVNRAMVNPELQPRVTGVSGTMVGSRTIEREMGNIGSQIEQRVTGLGNDGQALTNEVGGAKVREIAQRQIEKSGQAAKVIYDRAEKQAAGIKVTPKESMQVLDSAIADLSETAGLNSEEIKFLQSLKSDFSKDLSVGALRRARTTLRKKISKGELTFGESEARVLSIMDAAANDISSGLVAQGKEGAAKLFGEADRLYRERAQYIEGTLQKFIGKRNSTMSDQQVFTKFKSLADPKGDGPSLAKFMSELTPEERGDVAATFAAELGRNRKGDFSTAFLVDQAEKLAKNPTALKAIFGDEGARSINNLIVLAKEHNRVTNAARGSQTGVRADYRTWLTNLVFSGGAGALGTAAQGAGTGAIAAAGTAAVIGGTKFGLDRSAARALMSPKVTSWLRATPRSADPKVIDAHFKRLAAIAKAEPAIAGDVNSLQELIINAANDNQTRAVASDQEPDRVRPER